MPALDLDALARAVAAVLKLDADVLIAKRTVYEGEYRINLYRNCLHVFRAGFGPHYDWNLHVLVGVDQRGHVIEAPHRVEFEGLATPDALSVLSTVWTHVNGQGEVEPDAALTELLDAVQSRNDLDWEDGFWGDAHYDAALRVEQALRHYRPDVAPHV